jgi:hypothetical protein
METTTVQWTDEETGYGYVVTATTDEVVSVRLDVATRATDETRRTFIRAMERANEDHFWAIVDAAFASQSVAA